MTSEGSVIARKRVLLAFVSRPFSSVNYENSWHFSDCIIKTWCNVLDMKSEFVLKITSCYCCSNNSVLIDWKRTVLVIQLLVNMCFSQLWDIYSPVVLQVVISLQFQIHALGPLPWNSTFVKGKTISDWTTLPASLKWHPDNSYFVSGTWKLSIYLCSPHLTLDRELYKTQTWTHGAILLGFCDQGQWCRWDDAREQGRKNAIKQRINKDLCTLWWLSI